jgi:IS5 family transposase
VGRYAHARQMRRMRRELKRLKTYLGRVYRDVTRKVASDDSLLAHFACLLGLTERLLRPVDIHLRAMKLTAR